MDVEEIESLQRLIEPSKELKKAIRDAVLKFIKEVDRIPEVDFIVKTVISQCGKVHDVYVTVKLEI